MAFSEEKLEPIGTTEIARHYTTELGWKTVLSSLQFGRIVPTVSVFCQQIFRWCWHSEQQAEKDIEDRGTNGPNVKNPPEMEILIFLEVGYFNLCLQQFDKS